MVDGHAPGRSRNAGSTRLEGRLEATHADRRHHRQGRAAGRRAPALLAQRRRAHLHRPGRRLRRDHAHPHRQPEPLAHQQEQGCPQGAGHPQEYLYRPEEGPHHPGQLQEQAVQCLARPGVLRARRQRKEPLTEGRHDRKVQGFRARLLPGAERRSVRPELRRRRSRTAVAEL